MPEPSLTVIAVTGTVRSRAERLVRTLAAQTIANEIEVLLVNLAPGERAGIEPAADLDLTVIHQPGGSDYGAARAEGVRRARAPLVAFLEDHTIPAPDWAEEVRNGFARSGPGTTAIAYAMTNGSPDTYFYRSVFMAEYGMLAHPLPEGEAPASTANNVAYRREALLALGARLDELLEMDFFLQTAIGAAYRISTAPRSLLAHETNTHLRDLVPGHFAFARLFAHRRVRIEGWSLGKRLLGAAAIPVLVPPLRLKRLFESLAGRPARKNAVAGLPLILLLYAAGALGEAWGVLRGGDLSARRLIWLELEAKRASRSAMAWPHR